MDKCQDNDILHKNDLPTAKFKRMTPPHLFATCVTVLYILIESVQLTARGIEFSFLLMSWRLFFEHSD